MGCKKPKYALYWKGRRIPNMTFATRKEAETAKGIEATQMESAEYTPSQMRRWFKVKKVR